MPSFNENVNCAEMTTNNAYAENPSQHRFFARRVPADAEQRCVVTLCLLPLHFFLSPSVFDTRAKMC